MPEPRLPGLAVPDPVDRPEGPVVRVRRLTVRVDRAALSAARRGELAARLRDALPGAVPEADRVATVLAREISRRAER